MPVGDEEAHREEVERWRAGRIGRLTAPDGWLSIVGLAWLRAGSNSIGSDPGNDVVLPAATAGAVIGSIEVAGGRAVAVLDPGSGVTHEGQAMTRLRLEDDKGGHPTVLQLGSVSFYVIRREHDLAVRIKDTESPARRTFHGIEHWPVDSRWRFEARFEPYRPERSVAVSTVLEMVETYRVPGSVAFDVDGATHRLDAFLESDDDDLFLVFGDLTNGVDTFGGGRYLYTHQAGPDGVVIVDFNRCYNPPCVFTPYATCPLPLPQNRLAIRVEAGEKAYGQKP